MTNINNGNVLHISRI